MKCPDCKAELKVYCVKHKATKKLRYYKCDICGKKLITQIIETEWIIKK